jgi:hypothetical protein
VPPAHVEEGRSAPIPAILAGHRVHKMARVLLSRYGEKPTDDQSAEEAMKVTSVYEIVYVRV